MAKTIVDALLILILNVLLVWGSPAQSEKREGSSDKPVISEAEPRPADEPVGERPYEMVWANRRPVREPLINFDALDGWTLECRSGASAKLYPSLEQRVWNSQTAKLTYRGTRILSTPWWVGPPG